jgi:hypothetical protein
MRSAKEVARNANPATNGSVPHSVLRVFSKNAKGAARTKGTQNCFAPHSVFSVRVKSAKEVARNAKPATNGSAPHSVLPVFSKNAKGAARTEWARNCFAPRSVLRLLLKSRNPGQPKGI